MTDPFFDSDLDPNAPTLIGDKPPPSKHRVREHERTIPGAPTKLPDPEVEPPLFGWPVLEPQPRTIPVQAHVRKNPTRNPKEPLMTSISEPIPDQHDRATAIHLADEAHARHGDPVTSHQAAASVNPRGSQLLVLAAFQAREEVRAEPVGFTDEALAERVEFTMKAMGKKVPSPSRLRTARKELQRAGLVDHLLDSDGLKVSRGTRYGNDAHVYVLTDAGRAFPAMVAE